MPAPTPAPTPPPWPGPAPPLPVRTLPSPRGDVSSTVAPPPPPMRGLAFGRSAPPPPPPAQYTVSGVRRWRSTAPPAPLSPSPTAELPPPGTAEGVYGRSALRRPIGTPCGAGIWSLVPGPPGPTFPPPGSTLRMPRPPGSNFALDADPFEPPPVEPPPGVSLSTELGRPTSGAGTGASLARPDSEGT